MTPGGIMCEIRTVGSDSIGALDFQRSASEYVPRGGGNITLEYKGVSVN